MDPWVLLALIAAAIGVGTLASNSAAQATASLPRVTSFSMVDLPTPGINGQWDLWVTGINGLIGQPMLANIIPGHQMIYIPAAIAQAQPTNVDFKYTFTPRGSNAPWTILVPASILQAYAQMPKTEMIKKIMNAMVNQQVPNASILIASLSASGCSSALVAQAISDANYLLSGSGSSPLGTLQGGTFQNASDKVSWLTNNGALIAAIVNEVVTAVSCATSDEQSMLGGLKSTIMGWAGQAGVSSLSSLIGGIGGGGSDAGGGGAQDQGQSQDQAPQDQPQQSQDVPAPTDS